MKSLSLFSLIAVAATLAIFYINKEARASAPGHWVYLGNELEDVVDPETGKTIRYLTSGENVDFHFHYHGESWGEINGNTYLFFTSFRERPAQAGDSVRGERQILAANVDNGDLFYLTTIPNELPGAQDQWEHRQYNCTYYAPRKEIFFFDKKRQKIYVHDCIGGETKLLVTLPQGGVGRQLNVDGDKEMTRLIYGYSVGRGVEEMQDFIEYIDMDKQHNKTDGRRIAESGKGEAMNHIELRPGDKDYFLFKHHSDLKDGRYQDVKLIMRNIHNADDNVIVNPDNGIVDHMVWGDSGKYVFYDDRRSNLIRFDVETQMPVILTSGIESIHNKLSSDERLWLYDSATIHPQGLDPVWQTQVPNGRKVQNYDGSISIYNIETGKNTKYANIIWGHPHPRHPHAIFSHDDRMISFVTGAPDSVNTRLAMMKVDSN